MTLVDKTRFTPTPTFRARRKRVVLHVQVEGAGGPPQDAMVRDISATGISAVARMVSPQTDDVISIGLPDGTSVWGIVRWSAGKAFGVEFDPTSHRVVAAGLLDNPSSGDRRGGSTE